MSAPVGSYREEAFGEPVGVRLWRVEDLLEHVGPGDRADTTGAVCGASVEGDLDVLVELAEEAVEPGASASAWAIGDEAFPGAGVRLIHGPTPGCPFLDAFFLPRFPEDAPAELLRKIEGCG